MANPAVTLLSQKAPLGNQYVVTARLTWTTYAQAAADKVTAASLGLVWISHVEVNQPNILGTNVVWDRVQGASPGLKIYVDDIAGVSADSAATANTTVIDIVAFGF